VSESQNSISSKFQTSLDLACGVKSLIISNLSICLQAELSGRSADAKKVIIDYLKIFCDKNNLDYNQIINYNRSC
jgi:hypothetical protein